MNERKTWFCVYTRKGDSEILGRVGIVGKSVSSKKPQDTYKDRQPCYGVPALEEDWKWYGSQEEALDAIEKYKAEYVRGHGYVYEGDAMWRERTFDEMWESFETTQKQ